jgi:catechol 2,3-dioxygenase-like lactoylglutathione lyase family enzyme
MELRICMDVNDMERAIAFYTGGLGLQVGRRFGNDFVELLGAACPIDLLFNAAGTQPVPGSREPRNYQRHWLLRLQQLGALLEMPVTDRAWGRIAGLADPFGHGLDLLQFQGRGYDEMLQPE